MNTDLTKAQKDYALFLPAISSFYSTYIGKQQSDPQAVPSSRMPKGIPDMEMMNFFNPKEGLFQYKYGLYSAGHANLDLTKEVPKEDMIRKRGKHTLLLADSGGFQIAKGVWAADWMNPKDKVAEKYRSTTLKWLCKIADYSMTLDIPTWTPNVRTDVSNKEAEALKKKYPDIAIEETKSKDKKSVPTGYLVNIHTYDDAVTATNYNHEYFMKHSTDNAKFLNVLQGSNHSEADHWYDMMKHYNDHSKHEKPFKGWAMGGANMADPHLVLKRIVTIIDDGLLKQGENDWMHFLGTSKLEWAVMLTDIQRAVRRTSNPDFTISFDCASPFLATANGQIYYKTKLPCYQNLNKENKAGKWSYSMEATADKKAYASDTRTFRDGVIAEHIHEDFEDSPISKNLMMKDICVYAPGDVNKNGKEGKTSWDSFSYALMMGHNVWHHINAVQEANKMYDNGCMPKMLIDTLSGVTFRDIVNTVFSVPDLETRLLIINDYTTFFMGIAGARGMGGKKARGPGTQSKTMFDIDVTLYEKEKPKKTEVNGSLFNFGE